MKWDVGTSAIPVLFCEKCVIFQPLFWVFTWWHLSEQIVTSIFNWTFISKCLAFNKGKMTLYVSCLSENLKNACVSMFFSVPACEISVD